MKTLTMDPIEICTPIQSPIVIPFVYQVCALIFKFSRDELSQTSLIIQLYTNELYPYTLLTCATFCLTALWQRMPPKKAFVSLDAPL